MASALAVRNDYAGVPEELVPRLRGIRRYVSTLNAGRMAGIMATVKALDQHGICPLLLQDTALRLKYPGALQRHMWQGELAVREEEYRDAVKLAEALGFTTEEHLSCTIARRGTTEYVILYPYGADRYLWEGAVPFPVGGANALMPDDHMVILGFAEYVWHCYPLEDAAMRLIRWIMDIHPVLSAGKVDWETLAVQAKEKSIGHKLRLMLDTYRCFAPEVLPPSFSDRLCPEKELSRHLHPEGKLKGTIRTLSQKFSRGN